MLLFPVLFEMFVLFSVDESVSSAELFFMCIFVFVQTWTAVVFRLE